MNLTIEPSVLKGTLRVIASKSLSHRYLIAASLSENPSTIHNLMASEDIDATKKALIQLGAIMHQNTVHGPLHIDEPITIDAYASGSTLRFLIPLALLFKEEVTFIGRDRLPKRSLLVYETLFKNQVVVFNRVSSDFLPLKVKGPLKSGHYKLRGDVSSQFITGLLFALSTLNEPSTLTIIPPFESKPYVDLTVATLKDFGIDITYDQLTYSIPKNEGFKGINKTIEGDYSQAAFFIVAGLIGKNPLTILDLNKDSLQGDKAILSIIERMGGKVTFEEGRLTVFPSTTYKTKIDLKDIPDLGPILMILAALSKGTTIFSHINRLRIKESDRIKAMEITLKKLGVHFKTFKDSMHVTGRLSFKVHDSFDSFHDHRIVMSLMIASLRSQGDILIHHAEAINKSYPSFISEMTNLGARIKKEVKA